MGKSSWNDYDSNSDVSDDLSLESISFKVVELENALCNQDKLLCRVFMRTKILILSWKTLLLKLLLFDRCTIVTEPPRGGVHHEDQLERFSVKQKHNQHS
jgi:hypothetical protein